MSLADIEANERVTNDKETNEVAAAAVGRKGARDFFFYYKLNRNNSTSIKNHNS